MNESTSKLLTTLRGHGFNDLDGSAYWFDKGKTPPYILCFYRLYHNQHQYLTLTTYKGAFVEGWYQIYHKPYDSRSKQRQIPLAIGLPRTEDELLNGVNQVYPLPLKSSS